MKNSSCDWRQYVLRDLMFIVALFSVFVLLALISPITQKTNMKWLIFDVVLLALLNVWLILAMRKQLKKLPGRMIIAFKDNRYVAALLVLVAVSRIFMIGDAQRWDAGEYYYALGTACERFDFSPITFVAEFRLCRHSTLAISLFSAMGEFLTPRNPVGVQIVVLILTVAALGCLSRLFREFFGTHSEGKAVAATAVCACVPLFWGTFSYFNPDYFTLLFFLFFLYAQHKNRLLLMIFWGICVTQTKEPGILLLFGYAIARILVCILTAKGNLMRKICNAGKNPVNWCLLIVGGCYVIFLIVVKILGLSIWNQSTESANSFRWSKEPWNCFGYHEDYMQSIFKQVFVLNYAWVIWLGILIGGIWLLRKRAKREKVNLNAGNTTCLAGAMVLYLLFTSLYVTFDIYRYHQVFVFGSVILFAVIMAAVLEGSRTYMTVSGICALLLGSQTFLFGDPVSNLLFKTLTTGSGEMLFTATMSEYYGDFLVNNYRFTWIDQALDKFLEEIGYDKDTQIVLTPSETTGLMINGNGGVYVQNWDTVHRRRTMKPAGDDIISISTISTGEVDVENSDMVVNKIALTENAYLLLVPYYEYEEQEMVEACSHYYTVGERHMISVNGGELYYYPLIKISDGVE